MLDLIHDYPVSYPVAFDMEDSTQGNLSKRSWQRSQMRSAKYPIPDIIRLSMQMKTG